jgi:predicted nucleotidyltransferase
VDIYGPRLKGLYLFGSHARNEATGESDCDVLIVLDRVAGYGAEIDRTSILISRLSLAHRVSLSRVFVSADDWRSRKTAFLDNVREEAVPA